MTSNAQIQSLWLQAKRLLGQNQLLPAKDVLRLICKSSPSDIAAWLILGQVEGQAGEYVSAESCFRKAVALAPVNAEAHYGLGCSLMAQRKIADAATSFRSAISIKPGYTEALNDLGYALQSSGKLDEAVDAYSRSLSLKPQQFPTQYNLGLILKDQGKHADAEMHFRSALLINSQSAEAENSLGFVLKEAGRFQEAEQCFRRALEINPKYADAQFNLGSTLALMLQYCAAEACFRTALQLKPEFPDAYNGLGSVLLAKGDIVEAETCYRNALHGKPENRAAHGNLLMSLHYRETLSPKDLFAEHAKWGRQFIPSGMGNIPLLNSPDPLRRLRVGYVSPDFCIHSVASFLLPLFLNHDPDEVELVCYSNTERQDEITLKFRELTSLWRDVRGISDDDVARQIRDDRIDILVDLSGHTGRSRLRVFANRAAPVQLTYLGYPDTTGLQSMDYRLTDIRADPPGSESFHTEKLLYLPGGFLCYSPLFETPSSTPLPLLANGHITFGSFNNLSKVNSAVLRCWAAILNAVPGARLLLKTKSFWDNAVIEHFKARLTACGIAPQSVELRPWAVHPKDHLLHYQEIDIALDTFPYNGTTTTCEALWMGAPVITLAGNIHAGRVGVSLLSSIGLEELIAQTPDDYVAIASRLAGDTARLSALRASLRQRMQQSRLCTGNTFAQDVEHAYRSIWRDRCATAQGPTPHV